MIFAQLLVIHPAQRQAKIGANDRDLLRRIWRRKWPPPLRALHTAHVRLHRHLQNFGRIAAILFAE
jgi:hypothetical protein